MVSLEKLVKKINDGPLDKREKLIRQFIEKNKDDPNQIVGFRAEMVRQHAAWLEDAKFRPDHIRPRSIGKTPMDKTPFSYYSEGYINSVFEKAVKGYDTLLSTLKYAVRYSVKDSGEEVLFKELSELDDSDSREDLARAA